MPRSELSIQKEREVVKQDLKIESAALLQKLTSKIAQKFLSKRHDNPGRTELDDVNDLHKFLSTATAETYDQNSLYERWDRSLNNMFQAWWKQRQFNGGWK